MSDWPPRFTVTPAGAAGLFLLAAGLGGHATGDTQERLAALLEEFYRQGAKNAEQRILALEAEIDNVLNAKRYDLSVFDDDTSFADWALSRLRHTRAILHDTEERELHAADPRSVGPDHEEG